MASIKITAKEKGLVEHYFYGIISAGVAAHEIYPTDSWKNVAAKALIGGLVAPILARINPKSLVNNISTATGAPAPLVAQAVDTALADAGKIVAEETPAK